MAANFAKLPELVRRAVKSASDRDNTGSTQLVSSAARRGRQSRQRRWGRVVLQNKPKWVPLYVAGFQFRYNRRMNAGIFGTAIRRV